MSEKGLVLLSVLGLLRKRPTLTITEIAQATPFDRDSVDVIVRRAHEDGYLVRVRENSEVSGRDAWHYLLSSDGAARLEVWRKAAAGVCSERGDDA